MTSKESDVSEGVEPCPFCGGEAEYIANSFHRGAKNMVSCKRCGAQAFWRKWNTRVSPPLPSQGVERRLRNALRPFARVAEEDIGSDESDDSLYRAPNRAPLLNAGHFRRARAALSALPLDGGGCASPPLSLTPSGIGEEGAA